MNIEEVKDRISEINARFARQSESGDIYNGVLCEDFIQMIANDKESEYSEMATEIIKSLQRY